jgi:hypothetical protein
VERFWPRLVEKRKEARAEGASFFCCCSNVKTGDLILTEVSSGAIQYL